jgi:hypothetical protein
MVITFDEQRTYLRATNWRSQYCENVPERPDAELHARRQDANRFSPEQHAGFNYRKLVAHSNYIGLLQNHSNSPRHSFDHPDRPSWWFDLRKFQNIELPMLRRLVARSGDRPGCPCRILTSRP